MNNREFDDSIRKRLKQMDSQPPQGDWDVFSEILAGFVPNCTVAPCDGPLAEFYCRGKVHYLLFVYSLCCPTREIV